MHGKRMIALLACCMLLAGCAAPLVFFAAGGVGGVAGYKYYEGVFNVTYKARYIDTWQAVNQTAVDLQLVVQSAKHDVTEGKIVAKRADGERIVVSLKYKSAHETDVGIRVGTLGDQEASKIIAEQIRKELFGK
jgi:hypothetical protein